MPIMGFGRMNADTSHEELVEIVAKMQKVLDYLMQGGLDSKNIRASSIVADRMDVTELSAIAANLGVITAGSLTTNTEINVGTDARIGNILYLNETDSVVDKGIRIGSNVEVDVISGDLSIRALGGNITLTAAGDVFANGGKVATQGISVSVDVMGSDGITPVSLTFTNGVLTAVS